MPFDPSVLQIISLNLDDKRRSSILEKDSKSPVKAEAKKEIKTEKKEAKPASPKVAKK